MRPTAVYQITHILRYSTDPNKADWLKKFTMRMIDLKIAMTRKRITVNILERLHRKGLGTNDVELMSRNYHFGGGRQLRGEERELQRKNFIRREMNARMKDAQDELRRATRKFERSKNYFWSNNVSSLGYNRELNKVMQEEVTYEWEMSKRKMDKKVKHISMRWSREKVVEDSWRNIAISDGALKRFVEQNEEYERQTKDVPIYGDTAISENQRSILQLPPGFTTYEQVSETEMETEMEVMMNKARWEHQNKKNREGEEWSEDWQDEEIEEYNTYNSEKKVLDFSKLKVTELPTCRRITLPGCEDESLELQLRITKEKMMNVVKEYKLKYCDGKGNIKDGNLTRQQKDGLKECKDMNKTDKQVYYMTDKSRMMSVDTPGNYVDAMKKHTQNDEKINARDVSEIEKKMNGHAVMFARFLKMGEKWEHEKRIKQAITTYYGPIPMLFGLRKDHKKVAPEKRKEGPPTRPVCAASSSINGPLSHILSEVLNKLADEMDETIGTECRSTEEMVAGFENINNMERRKTVVWSSDVKALYPSFKVEEVAKTISKEFEESKLEIDVNDEELGLYIALVSNRERIESLGLTDVTSTWKNEGSRGQRPGITTAEVMGGMKAKSKSLFNKPEWSPSKKQRKQMIALALEYGISTVMSNHTYQFDGEVFMQKDGGPIGLELTGAVARVFMLSWDRRFLTRVENMTRGLEWQMYMYRRYVDDCNCIGEEIPPGTRVENDRLLIKPECVDQDKAEPADKRTASIMQEVANGVCDFIQVETDYPSCHDNGLMPILDLAVQMEDNMVTYRHYRKEMANFKLIMKNSAMPFKMTKTCLVQEVVRILRNTSRRLNESVKTHYLNEFSLRMKESGYDANMRLDVIKLGIGAYEKQIERENEGICPLYRPKGYDKASREKKKSRTKMSWSKPYDSVLFCPPTPKGMLAKGLKEVIRKERQNGGINIKVVERAGVKIRSMLPGLKEQNDCERQDCVIHANGGKGQCNREGIVYRGQCVTCKEAGKQSIYIGESGRSGYVRGKQHKAAMNNPNRHQNNAFGKHIMEVHEGGTDVQFKVDVIRSYKKPLERQVREGVEIYNIDADIVMNSKIDYFQPGLRRLGFNNLFED